jgi:thioredoxin-dependent peroxiredoxin
LPILRQLRIVCTSVVAVAAGLVNLALGRGERHPILLNVGDVAPDFALTGSDGSVHQLSDSLGREAVVLAWFPKAFTGGCTVQCEAMGRSAAAIGAFKARHYGISVDDVKTNREFAEALGVDYPILSDPRGEVARAYGVLGPSGFPSRTTFFIGRDGHILHVDRRVNPLSHGRDIAAMLGNLQIPRH